MCRWLIGNRGALTMLLSFLAPSLAARLEYALLRGSHALLDSSLPPLSCAMLCHVQRGTIPRARYRVESFV